MNKIRVVWAEDPYLDDGVSLTLEQATFVRAQVEQAVRERIEAEMKRCLRGASIEKVEIDLAIVTRLGDVAWFTGWVLGNWSFGDGFDLCPLFLAEGLCRKECGEDECPCGFFRVFQVKEVRYE